MAIQVSKHVSPRRISSSATLTLTDENGTVIREDVATQVLASEVEFGGSFGGSLFSAVFFDGAYKDGSYIFLTEGHNNTACRYLGDGFFHQLNAKIELTVSTVPNVSKRYDAVITGYYDNGNGNTHAHMNGYIEILN